MRQSIRNNLRVDVSNIAFWSQFGNFRCDRLRLGLGFWFSLRRRESGAEQDLLEEWKPVIILDWSGAVYRQRRRANRLPLNIPVDLSSHLFINLTAAANTWRWPPLSGVYALYCWLLTGGGKCTVLHDQNFTEGRGGKRRKGTRISGVCWF